MSLDTIQLTPIQNKQSGEDFNLQKIIGQLLHFWWLFFLFLVLALACAYVYLRYSTPQYKVQAQILVKDSKKGGGISGADVFQDLELLGGTSSADNEVQLLRSRTLMGQTVEALQQHVRYYAEGKLKQTELFGKTMPFTATITEMQEDSLFRTREILFTPIASNSFKLQLATIEKNANYGDTISFSFFKMVINKTNYRPDYNTPITILIGPKENAVAGFQKELTVGVTGKTVSTIDLTLNDAVPERGELLLNTLISIYNRMNTEDKNRIADSTITFIDNRLVYVSQELGEVEKEIEQFRQRNELTNMSAQGQLLLENSSQYVKQLSEQEVQIAIVNSLEEYLKDKQNTSRTIPAGLVIQDATFSSLVEKYNNLQLEMGRHLQTTTESNPVVQRLIVQIAALKADIIDNLATIKRTMQITSEQLKRRTSSFESKIKQVPGKERTFLEFSRQQSIKQELYLYLMKKREETAVSKAANIDNARVVDAAKAQRTPFTPKPQLLYMAAMLVGLVIPGLILYVRSLLNNKVETKQDITNVTTAPVVGEIGRSPYPDSLIVTKNTRHPVAEQFRLLRTNIDYMVPATTNSRTIMVTSSMSGEGKSFLSLNLAAMLALGGKRVALLEFDLRKPKLSKYLGVENAQGLSTFLIGKISDADIIARPVEGVESLYMVPSGPIPPNPAELINGEQAPILFSQLKASFDHVVIDVPPVGVVSDALLLSAYAADGQPPARDGQRHAVTA